MKSGASQDASCEVWRLLVRPFEGFKNRYFCGHCLNCTCKIFSNRHLVIYFFKLYNEKNK